MDEIEFLRSPSRWFAEQKISRLAKQKALTKARRTMKDRWRLMLRRCEDPLCERYRDYGGRGIKVCDRWHDFEAFLQDVGFAPFGKTLDRKDNDGNYEPGNWRWATPVEQAANKRPRRGDVTVMGSIIQRGKRWRAQIRKSGHRALCKTFDTKGKAQRWIMDMESMIETGKIVGQRVNVSKLIEWYRELREISRPILDTSNEHYMLNHLEAFLGDKTNLVPQDLVDFAKWRKKEGAGVYTINMEVSKLGTVLKYAGSARGLDLPDVVQKARPLLGHLGLIGGGGRRERRPTEDEIKRIIEFVPEQTGVVFRFMIATAMRRGEVCRLRFDDLDREKRLILVRDRKDPRRKAGNDQWIPLLGDAWEIVRHLKPNGLGAADVIFPVHPQTLSKLFKATCDALSIPDLHLHDLRHEGISRMFEAGYSIEQVALVSGHGDWRHLRRYTNLRPESLHELSPVANQSSQPRPARLRIVSRQGKSE